MNSCATRRSTRSAILRSPGAPLIGAYRSVRGGHKLNHAVLCALMADPTAWTYVDAGQMARRTRTKPDIAAALAVPAFGFDAS